MCPNSSGRATGFESSLSHQLHVHAVTDWPCPTGLLALFPYLHHTFSPTRNSKSSPAATGTKLAPFLPTPQPGEKAASPVNFLFANKSSCFLSTVLQCNEGSHFGPCNTDCTRRCARINAPSIVASDDTARYDLYNGRSRDACSVNPACTDGRICAVPL